MRRGVLVSCGSFSKVNRQQHTRPHDRRQEEVMKILSIESAVSLLTLYFLEEYLVRTKKTECYEII